jgi:cell division protein FtsZ
MAHLESIRDLASMTGSTRPVLAIGVGGAGNDLLTHVMDASPDGLYCIAADTDRYHLQIVRAHSKVLMKGESGDDAGTSGNVGLGKIAAASVCHLFESQFDAADLVFVLSGLGGGTGTGAAPVISSLARKAGAVVVGLVTHPFPFEKGKFRVAINGLRTLLNSCDTVVMVDSQPLTPFSLTLPFQLSLDSPGQTCCRVVNAIADGFARPDVLSHNLNEFRTMLRCGGLARAAIGDSYSTWGLEGAILTALRNSTSTGEFAGVKGVYVHITGQGELRRADLVSAMELLSQRVNPDAHFIYSCCPYSEYPTRVNLIATGVPFPYVWGGYRSFPLDLDELEPESGGDENLDLDLDLDQMEDVPV